MQPLAPEQRDKPGASSYQQETPESKGESVSGEEWRRVAASRNAAETNSLDRSFCQQKDCCDMHYVSLSIADRVARFVHLRHTRTCSATGSSSKLV